ncbi:hypothetical protein AB0N79_34245 [Streptomyces microflavus]
MPTYETLPRFTTDLEHLTPQQRRRFRRTVAAFVDDSSPTREAPSALPV